MPALMCPLLPPHLTFQDSEKIPRKNGAPPIVCRNNIKILKIKEIKI